MAVSVLIAHFCLFWGIAGLSRRSSGLQPPTPYLNPKFYKTPLPSLANYTTLENIDGAIGYSYTCIDNGEVVVIYWVGCRGEYRNNRLMG